MELAGTPSSLRESVSTDHQGGRTAAVRAVSLADARDPAFRDEWTQLAQRASEPNPFFEPWFLLPSLEAFAGEGNAPQLLAFTYEGRLTGLMPLSFSRDYYGYPVPFMTGWLHANAFYGAPLVARGFEHSFWHALLDHCDRNLGTSAFLHLPLLKAGGALDAALAHVFEQTGRPSAIVARQERAMLRSELSPEEYLAQALSKKHAKELRRQRRRLADHGDLRFEPQTGADGLDRWIARFLALEAAGWKGDAGSALASEEATRSFFTEVLLGAAEAGKLERATLTLDGKPIAMLASFVTYPGCFSFKTAFDERFHAHSPGMQLQIDNLSILDRPDIDWTDSCAAEGHPMIDRLWTERRHLVTRNVAIGGAARRTLARLLMAFETRKGRP